MYGYGGGDLTYDIKYFILASFQFDMMLKTITR